MKKNRHQKGFTLVEMLIVTAFLGILLLTFGGLGFHCLASGSNPCETPWGYRDRRCTGYYAPQNHPNPYEGR